MGKNARTVKVKVAEYHPDLSKKYKFYMVPSRWVHELYPVDEMFQRDLGIAKESFTVELVSGPKDTYTLEASDASGSVVESRIDASSGVERLDEAARKALSLCKFTPGAIDGRPEQSWHKMKYVWQLDR